MKNLHKGLIFFGLITLLFCLSKCAIYYDLTGKCPCNKPECGLDELPEDANGKYKQGEWVLSFPDTADLKPNNPNFPIIDNSFIKKKIIEAYKMTNNNQDKPIPPDSITITRCICDENIFLITSDILIGSETNVAEAANTQEEIRREGGIFSLNYIVENTNATEEIPKGLVTDSPIPAPSDSFSLEKSKPIVAILDSGLDFGKFAGEYDGIYLKASSETDVCGITDDDFGYNFIGPGSPNNNIQDLNGHGTVVSLSLKSRLETISNVDWDSQRMLIVKVLDDCGNGTIFSTICGLAYAREKGADIINCSWGLYFNDIQLQRAIKQIPLETAIVSSGGNNGETLGGNPGDIVHFPSGYGFYFQGFDLTSISTSASAPTQPYNLTTTSPQINVYEVLAVDHNLNYSCSISTMSSNLADYSNERPGSYAEPANNVQSIIPNNPCPSNQINGTSFAAPALAASLVHARLNPPSVTASTPPTRLNIKNATTTIVGTNNPCFGRTICQ